jgi:hypothetical protein
MNNLDIPQFCGIRQWSVPHEQPKDKNEIDEGNGKRRNEKNESNINEVF